MLEKCKFLLKNPGLHVGVFGDVNDKQRGLQRILLSNLLQVVKIVYCPSPRILQIMVWISIPILTFISTPILSFISIPIPNTDACKKFHTNLNTRRFLSISDIKQIEMPIFS